LGPNQSTAVIYNWRWNYGRPNLALWLILIASFIFVRGNRNPQALLVIIPLLLLNLLWLALKKATALGPAEAEMPNMAFNSMSIGITVLWLFAHKLGNRKRFVTFLMAFSLMGVLGIVGTVSYLGLEFSQQTDGGLILLAISVLALLLGFALAGWGCQNCYSGLRFVLYLAFWTVAASLACTLVLYPIAFSIDPAPVPLSAALLVGLVVGLMLGGCLYVISLPYMILVLHSPLLRERFYTCMRLSSMPPTCRQGEAKHPNEKDSDAGTPENLLE
jgi:hypothetical protein